MEVLVREESDGRGKTIQKEEKTNETLKNKGRK
jgi:hypothetical protein